MESHSEATLTGNVSKISSPSPLRSHRDWHHISDDEEFMLVQDPLKWPKTTQTVMDNMQERGCLNKIIKTVVAHVTAHSGPDST